MERHSDNIPSCAKDLHEKVINTPTLDYKKEYEYLRERIIKLQAHNIHLKQIVATLSKLLNEVE